MYKKISFRGVFKLGRMTAPGFVFCGRMIGQTGVGRGSGPEDATTRRMEGGGHLVAYQPGLQFQPERLTDKKARKKRVILAPLRDSLRVCESAKERKMAWTKTTRKHYRRDGLRYA